MGACAPLTPVMTMIMGAKPSHDCRAAQELRQISGAAAAVSGLCCRALQQPGSEVQFPTGGSSTGHERQQVTTAGALRSSLLDCGRP